MSRKLPILIVTGASGFIGRNFLEMVKNDYKIVAIARRSQKKSEVADHHNIHWVQCDIGNWSSVEKALIIIEKLGNIEFILHLAGYYDFDYSDKPEYYYTNVKGTEHVLKMAEKLKIKHFIFSSSLAICPFPEKNNEITEQTLPNANFSYAKTKKLGEEMIKEYSNQFSCSIVRLAAIFSDWCEYPPLYKFLSTWTSSSIKSKILAGKGESAITYLHTSDLNKFFKAILKKYKELPSYNIYSASPNGSISHNELFKLTTHYYYGYSKNPIYVPKIMAFLGLGFQALLRFFNIAFKNSFERLWMVKYIDKKLNVNSNYTQKILSWKPVSRYMLTRRIFFLVENMKRHPNLWKLRNDRALKKTTQSPSLLIYEHLVDNQEVILKQIVDSIHTYEDEYLNYFKKIDKAYLNYKVSTIFLLLATVIRNEDRGLLLDQLPDFIFKSYSCGFEAIEEISLFSLFHDYIILSLYSDEKFNNMKQEIYDYVTLTIQLAQDEVEDLFEMYSHELNTNYQTSLLSD